MDAYKFHNYMLENKSYFQGLIGDLDELVVYGEWAGPGIQRKVSVSKIPEKAFFIFSCLLVEKSKSRLVTDPADIENILSSNQSHIPKNTHIIPWHGNPVQLKFSDKSAIEQNAIDFNDAVDMIDLCDPFIQATYGIEGRGEGLVFYPLGIDDNKEFERYAFKVKGKSHSKAQGAGAKARVTVPIAEGVSNFVEMMVTPARITQGIQELYGNGPFEKGGIRPLINWVSTDVRSEGADELEAANLEWQHVFKLLSLRVREYYFAFLEDNQND